MFQVLVLACTDPAYCVPSSGDIVTAGYRSTPGSGDPYKYIRSGSYARILSQEAFETGALTSPQQHKMAALRQKEADMKNLGLRG
mmetsp:Transcript_24307/g.39169  ORF Transcript_24307/g.39169 Transcript_24307/m.39169 type:complete len:85 (-) Transcript_24307:39-293(-)